MVAFKAVFVDIKMSKKFQTKCKTCFGGSCGNLRITQWGFPLEDNPTIVTVPDIWWQCINCETWATMIVKDQVEEANHQPNSITHLISTILLVHISQPLSAHIVENTKKLKATPSSIHSFHLHINPNLQGSNSIAVYLLVLTIRLKTTLSSWST